MRMFRAVISYILIVTFTLTSVVTSSSAQTLPALPGGPSAISPQSSTLTDFNPTAVFNGIKIYPQEPFRFDFMMSDLSLRATEGSEAIQGKINSDEIASSLSAPRNDTEILKLVKYFMAALTVPEGDLWVNLSPVEPDRIVPHVLGQTEMGRDLLAQDYVLKQLTASLMSPEGEAGKKFWERVYEKIYEQNIPSPLWGGLGRGNNSAEHPHPASPIEGEESSVDDLIESFNKVWIVPNEVEVYQNGDVAYITKATLKVMLESDYLAEQESQSHRVAESQKDFSSNSSKSPSPDVIPAKAGIHFNNENGSRQPTEVPDMRGVGARDDSLVKTIIKDTILPLIEDEVNHGESFANLRQIFHSMILAKWYEQHFKNSILGQSYVDRNVTEGIELSDAMEGTRLPVIARSASDEAIPDNMNSDEIASASGLAMTEENHTHRTPNNASIQDIYNQYLAAFKSGAADVIKEDYDPVTQTVIPRKYFVGGVQLAVNNAQLVQQINLRQDQLNQTAQTVSLALQPDHDAAMLEVSPYFRSLFFRYQRLLRIKKDNFLLRFWGVVAKQAKGKLRKTAIEMLAKEDRPFAENILKELFMLDASRQDMDGLKDILKAQELSLSRINRRQSFEWHGDLIRANIKSTNWTVVEMLIRSAENVVLSNREQPYSHLNLSEIHQVMAWAFDQKPELIQDSTLRAVVFNSIDLRQKDVITSFFGSSSIKAYFLAHPDLQQELLRHSFQVIEQHKRRWGVESLQQMIWCFMDRKNPTVPGEVVDLLSEELAKIDWTYRQSWEEEAFFDLLVNFMDRMVERTLPSIDQKAVASLEKAVEAGSWEAIRVLRNIYNVYPVLRSRVSSIDMKSVRHGLIRQAREVLDHNLYDKIFMAYRVAGDLGDEMKAAVADRLRRDMLRGQSVALHLRDAQKGIPDFDEEFIDIFFMAFLLRDETISYWVEKKLFDYEPFIQGRLTKFFRKAKRFQAVGLHPTRELMDSGKTVPQLLQALREIKNGKMDINNPLHVELNYMLLLKDLNIRSYISREVFEEIVEQIRSSEDRGYEENADFSPTELSELRALAYEAYLLKQEILKFHDPVVVQNLSYGGVALAPLIEVSGDDLVIPGKRRRIPVISTKVGSSQSHHNPFVLPETIFTDAQIEELIRDFQDIVIVDGSRSVGRKEEKYPHFPDAFFAYRNFAIAWTAAAEAELRPEDYQVDQTFLDKLVEKPEFQTMVRRLRQIAQNARLPLKPLTLQFWYPGKSPLWFQLSPGENGFRKITKMKDGDGNGRRMILMQSVISPRDIPVDLEESFIGREHEAAFFDDKDLFKKFFLVYRKGYGLVHSKLYAAKSKEAYQALLGFLGGEEDVVDCDQRVIDLEQITDGKIRLNTRSGRMSFKKNPPEPVVSLDFDYWFVRHGETDGNSQGVFQGNVDEKINQLNQRGRQQAQAAAERLWTMLMEKFGSEENLRQTIQTGDVVFLTSPLGRAKETFQVFSALADARGVEVAAVIDPGLNEINFGVWSNRISGDLGSYEKREMARYRQSRVDIRPPAGESFADLLLRRKDALLAMNQKYAGKTVIAFGHGVSSGADRVLLGSSGLVDENGLISWRTKYMLPNAVPVILSQRPGAVVDQAMMSDDQTGPSRGALIVFSVSLALFAFYRSLTYMHITKAYSPFPVEGFWGWVNVDLLNDLIAIPAAVAVLHLLDIWAFQRIKVKEVNAISVVMTLFFVVNELMQEKGPWHEFAVSMNSPFAAGGYNPWDLVMYALGFAVARWLGRSYGETFQDLRADEAMMAHSFVGDMEGLTDWQQRMVEHFRSYQGDPQGLENDEESISKFMHIVRRYPGLHVEIHAGDGSRAYEKALQYPEMGFIALDNFSWNNDAWGGDKRKDFAARTLPGREQKNYVFLRADAKVLLGLFPELFLKEVYVYNPDPNSLFDSTSEIVNALNVGGRLVVYPQIQNTVQFKNKNWFEGLSESGVTFSADFEDVYAEDMRHLSSPRVGVKVRHAVSRDHAMLNPYPLLVLTAIAHFLANEIFVVLFRAKMNREKLASNVVKDVDQGFRPQTSEKRLVLITLWEDLLFGVALFFFSASLLPAESKYIAVLSASLVFSFMHYHMNDFGKFFVERAAFLAAQIFLILNYGILGFVMGSGAHYMLDVFDGRARMHLKRSQYLDNQNAVDNKLSSDREHFKAKMYDFLNWALSKSGLIYSMMHFSSVGSPEGVYVSIFLSVYLSITLFFRSDRAMMSKSQQNPGGIDLNRLNMKTSGTVDVIQTPTDKAMMNVPPIHALTPKILNIGTMMVCDFLSLNPDGTPKSEDHADNSGSIPALAFNRDESAFLPKQSFD